MRITAHPRNCFGKAVRQTGISKRGRIRVSKGQTRLKDRQEYNLPIAVTAWRDTHR